MRKILQQIVGSCEGWEVFFLRASRNHSQLSPGSPVCKFRRLRDGPDEVRYIAGMVVTDNGTKIGGINDTPGDIGNLGYLYAKLSKKKVKERMDYFKDQANQLMKIRKSRSSKKIRGTKRGKKRKS